jgi:succinate dehydrogenase/fumarate reductase cytochrome b subunit
MSTYVYLNLGGSEIIIIGIYLAVILFLYFVIVGVKAFFQELNK